MGEKASKSGRHLPLSAAEKIIVSRHGMKICDPSVNNVYNVI